MRHFLAAAFLVLPLSLFAQQSPVAAPPAQPTTTAPSAEAKPSTEPSKGEPQAAAPKKEVPPDAAVITLSGPCPAGETAPKPADGCKTVITRAEFERIANALAPDAPAGARRQIAESYAQAVMINNEAVKEGVQNDPGAEEVFKYARMRAMGQLLARRVQQNSLKVSDDEIKKYFQEHLPSFEEAVLTRVIVPQRKGTKQKPATPAAEKAYAEGIRRRLIAGEKPGLLQAEAFKRAAIKANAPETDLGSRRRESLPPSQAQIFELKPGDVSPVLSEPTASFIYKVEAKTTPELDPTISDEIRKTIAGQRIENEAKRIGQSSVPTLNPDYFGEVKPAQSPVPGITLPSEPSPK